ncbi:Trk system potassium transporter TrkA [Longimonas halophila]|uniref:Trk system potassium uptake protein TrkA n=1 Tax=Longimonas halophila TaxID=1469170 RepID=A0A2H3NIM8_9BACT|nr:Trk system potassium transporter TrkA [Longimonas halophila]PEN05218.1 Trk system potassium transporter TrkA [Longimonas halophila]
MRIVVIGAGEVGFDVARMLSEEQHDVFVVDNDADVLHRVRRKLDVMTVHGNGTSASVLEDARIHEANMVVAVTAVDEVNLVACMMADRLGVPTTIARTRTSEAERKQAVLSTQDFGIDLAIHPEEAAAAEVVRLIQRASASEVLTFCAEQLQLIGVRIDPDSEVVGASMKELVAIDADIDFRIKAILRGNKTILPDGAERIQADDHLFIMTRPTCVSAVTKLLGKKDMQIRHIMIAGGTRVGVRTAQHIMRDCPDCRVKLIEPNADRAAQLAADLPNVLVLQGDTTDVELLVEEGLKDMDAFVAVSNKEEANLVTCLMAKEYGVHKTVAQLSKVAYIPMSEQLGLDAAVSTKLAVSHEVQRFFRGQHVLSVATVHGLNAEILEAYASPGAPITRGPLHKLDLPDGLLVAAVNHENGPIEIATGDTHIQANDRAIVFVLPTSVEHIESLFGT